MEHNGLDFALVRLERRTFDHVGQTGFLLEGKHRTLKCESCHNPAKIPAAARAEIKVKDLTHTFLGLHRGCTACHEDRHAGQLGADCTRCHSQEDWKQAPGFNHSSTAFPLTGLHQTVACTKCHVQRAGETRQVFKGLAFNECRNCHNDPHRGAFQEAKFRGSCENCHNTSGWKNSHLATGFRHEATRFPLEGKHAALLCNACHKGTDFRRPIAHEHCRDCHEDIHRGQFAARAGGSDCSACHGLESFKPARFDRETHRQSAFPLEGKHASVACEKCHPPAGRNTVYRTGKLACSACHSDKHAGEFASVPWNNKCELCHTTESFLQTTFSVARHAQTRFELTGRHATVACNDCHKPMPSVASSPRRHHFEAQTCSACHTDPHRTKVACETCHTTDQWSTIQPFDHSKAKFGLDGAHAEVKCIECHKVSTGKAPDFSAAQSQCASCHRAKDRHGGQFTSAPPQEDCSSCHTPQRWEINGFEHEKTRYPLDVAHRNVACIKCHKDVASSVSAKAIRLYRGTPTECVKCH